MTDQRTIKNAFRIASAKYLVFKVIFAEKIYKQHINPKGNGWMPGM